MDYDYILWISACVACLLGVVFFRWYTNPVGLVDSSSLHECQF